MYSQQSRSVTAFVVVVYESSTLWYALCEYSVSLVCRTESAVAAMIDSSASLLTARPAAGAVCQQCAVYMYVVITLSNPQRQLFSVIRCEFCRNATGSKLHLAVSGISASACRGDVQNGSCVLARYHTTL
jgi:hypothetical protein